MPEGAWHAHSKVLLKKMISSKYWIAIISEKQIVSRIQAQFTNKTMAWLALISEIIRREKKKKKQEQQSFLC